MSTYRGGEGDGRELQKRGGASKEGISIYVIHDEV